MLPRQGRVLGQLCSFWTTTAAVAAAAVAAVRILWANANYLAQLKIAVSTHIHTHTNTWRSNCNHSVCCLSLLFYFCLHFSVSGASAGAVLGPSPAGPDPDNRQGIHPLSYWKWVMQSTVHRKYFSSSKKKWNKEEPAKLCSIFISTSNVSYFWHLCM